MNNLVNFCNENGINENEAIGLIKAGIKKVEERERMRVREKARRDEANVALKFYKEQKGL